MQHQHSDNGTPMRYPPGHFHSPIVHQDEITKRSDKIFDTKREEIPGIDLRKESQLALLSLWGSYELRQMHDVIMRGETRYTENDQQSFNMTDAMVLHCMLRTVQPKRYIEIGCGYSSCMALDTNASHLKNIMQCTFIDPHTDLLVERMRPDDHDAVSVITSNLQDVDTDVFLTLQNGDVLFVDSTHVLKTDSDVCHILFRVLPSIASGVWIHFHDMFWPFEYPKEWVQLGRNWNELYAVRAFLTDNSSYDMQFFTSYVQKIHCDAFANAFPHSAQRSGGSLWIRKV